MAPSDGKCFSLRPPEQVAPYPQPVLEQAHYVPQQLVSEIEPVRKRILVLNSSTWLLLCYFLKTSN